MAQAGDENGWTTRVCRDGSQCNRHRRLYRQVVCGCGDESCQMKNGPKPLHLNYLYSLIRYATAILYYKNAYGKFTDYVVNLNATNRGGCYGPAAIMGQQIGFENNHIYSFSSFQIDSSCNGTSYLKGQFRCMEQIKMKKKHVPWNG